MHLNTVIDCITVGYTRRAVNEPVPPLLCWAGLFTGFTWAEQGHLLYTVQFRCCRVTLHFILRSSQAWRTIFTNLYVFQIKIPFFFNSAMVFAIVCSVGNVDYVVITSNSFALYTSVNKEQPTLINILKYELTIFSEILCYLSDERIDAYNLLS